MAITCEVQQLREEELKKEAELNQPETKTVEQSLLALQTSRIRIAHIINEIDILKAPKDPPIQN